jgi:HAD superfamily hydrolase (TIGR01509 family)
MNLDGLKIKGIFLDLDGTIVDSKAAYIEASKISFQAIGQKPPEQKVALEIPKRLEQGQSIGDITSCDPKKFLKIYYETFYSISQEKTKLIPNVSETLETLSLKAKLAVITMRHTPSEVITRELECLGISKYFTHIVTAMDTAMPKPSPEALIKCVEAFDVEMCSCIIAGDSVNDVRAGKAAGAATVAVLSGLYKCEELVKECPDLILKDLTELPAYIK